MIGFRDGKIEQIRPSEPYITNRWFSYVQFETNENENRLRERFKNCEVPKNEIVFYSTNQKVNHFLPKSRYLQVQPLIEPIWSGTIFGWLFVSCSVSSLDQGFQNHQATKVWATNQSKGVKCLDILNHQWVLLTTVYLISCSSSAD